jgi:preprotein translocase subunit SecA
MMNWLRKLVGDTNERVVKQLQPHVADINALEPEYQELSDEDLQKETQRFRERLSDGQETLDDLLPEAFATVRETARRVLGQRHYDVQLIGGIALHQGNIAEMRTGEGKTLVATLPLYLNALSGKGCHLVTVNDYLARVGAGWMGPIYHFLGLSVSVIAHDYSALYDPEYIEETANQEDTRLIHWRPCSRREAYAADITYGTNSEYGFDYLRDNMAIDIARTVQRELNFAIVDEVDNILIDEARTPLIISGPAQKSSDDYRRLASIIRNLHLTRSTVTDKQIKEGMEHDGDFFIDERSRSVSLTDAGIEKVERALEIPEEESLYDPKYYQLTHYVDNALKSQFIFQRDKDYMVTQQGEVVIVDEFTGRAMPGRRWSDGLHQAVEAKEGVTVRNENVTMATITYQNFFRMYSKLAGMTGTAYTEREEFAKIYNLDVVVIPTNKPVIRDDRPDQIYRSQEAKFKAVVRDVQELIAQGRPVLIGTTSVETSEILSELMRRENIRANVLNAKQHEREASVVAQAGRPGTVTVATNMAGRGTDILLGGNPDGLIDDLLARQGVKLEEATPEQQAAALAQAREITSRDGEKVRHLGGLHIIGTERHESRRIDNQLRGRAGRQGDPGSSRFYISLEDELMRRFGRMETIKRFMGSVTGEDDAVPIESRLLDRAIEGAQSRVEGFNFDLRKHTVEFDDVMNKQRQVIYADRRAILEGEDMHERVLEMMSEEIAGLVDDHLPEEDTERESWDYEALIRAVGSIDPQLPEEVTVEKLQPMSRPEIEDYLYTLIEEAYQRREEAIMAETMRYVERRMMLGAIDRQWIDYLTAMDELRQAINLQAYAQRDPLIEFKRRSFDMFDELKANITRDIVYHILPNSYQYEETMRRIEAEQQQRLAAAQRAGADMETVRGSRTVQRRYQKPGRNELCPCGSGKKFKHCHEGREGEIMHLLQSASGVAPSRAAQLAMGGSGTVQARPQPQGQGQAQNQAQVTMQPAPASSAQPQPDKPAASAQPEQQQPASASKGQQQAAPRGRAAPPPAANAGDKPARGKSGKGKGKKKKQNA